MATTQTSSAATGSASGVQPVGFRGNWKLVFHDGFSGTSLNTGIWTDDDGEANQNNVTAHASNLRVAHGALTLRLASKRSGAEIQTRHFRLAGGQYAEAQIEFSGSGTAVDDWPGLVDLRP